MAKSTKKKPLLEPRKHASRSKPSKTCGEEAERRRVNRAAPLAAAGA